MRSTTMLLPVLALALSACEDFDLIPTPAPTGDPTPVPTGGEPTPIPTPEPTPPPVTPVSDECTVESLGDVFHYACPYDWFWGTDSGASEGPTFTLNLPADTLSISAFVDDPGVSVGIGTFEVDGTTYVDVADYSEAPPAWATPPFYHWARMGGGFVLPQDGVLAPTGASILRVSGAAIDDQTGNPAVLHVYARSGLPETPSAMHINLVLVGETTLFQEELDATIEVVDRIWNQSGGPSVGTVDLYSTTGDSIIAYDDANDLRRMAFPAEANHGISVFFIQDFSDAAGTLGVAGGIPGPLGGTGVDGAGVLVALDPHAYSDGTLDTTTLGSTLAHEIGHQLGLFHTTESDGTRSDSLTTPECPSSADLDADGSYSATECEAYDGTNFMFWSAAAFLQEDVTADQMFVLGRSPISHGVTE